jgi:hypothetical protein
VTNGDGSRFFSYLNKMRDSSAVKLETRINGNSAPSAGTCNFNTRFPDGPEYRTDNSRDTLRDEIVYSGTKIKNTEK